MKEDMTQMSLFRAEKHREGWLKKKKKPVV